MSTYLKVGTTALVLSMIEDRFLAQDFTVDGAVPALRAVSHDPTLKELVTLTDGRKLTAVQLQMEYLDLAKKYVEDRLGSDADPQTLDVLRRWESVLDRLERDPMLCAGELDWVAKQKLLNQYRDRDGLEWDDAKLQLIDYQYSDIRPEKGLYHRLVGMGRIERLLDDPTIEAAMHDPPDRHPRVLPRPLPGEVRRARRRGLVGLGDLRPAGARVVAAGAHDRPPAGQPRARGGAAGSL